MNYVPLCPKCSMSKELHDAVWGCPAQPSDNQHPIHARIRTAAAYENIVGKRLTDRMIKKYLKQGRYGEEYKEARNKRVKKRMIEI